MQQACYFDVKLELGDYARTFSLNRIAIILLHKVHKVHKVESL